jgi:hypothetical protein
VSTELIENEIRRFLATPEPEVICVSGHWGVGKTFAWNQYLKDAHSKNKISLKRYSYVSLFGINSLDELKYAVFENSIKTSDIGAPPSLETLKSNLLGTIESLSRKAARTSAGVAQQTPFLKNYLGGLAPLWFSSVRNNVICIDDFERRGINLSVRDVLGLVNNLREVKTCKICLILNDEALEDSEADFRKYLEKVVDATLKFEPSPADCARIALGESSEITTLLAEHCVKLGISNIRVIKKIERSLRQVEPILAEFDKQVLKQAVNSLTLLGWSVCEPTRAPSLKYLEAMGKVDFAVTEQEKPVPENEALWNVLLRSYGFSSMDEFDLALLEGIRNGYFDALSVRKFGSELDKKVKAGNLDASFNAAWRMYHDSFEDNQEEVLDAMYDAFFKGVRYITPMNMNSTVALFKELGRPAQAGNMLKHYINLRSDESQLFNLRSNPFASSVSDPEVIQAFEDKYATFKHEASPTQILLSIADSRSWNAGDIAVLSALPSDEYYRMFKATRDPDLRKIVGACLMFDTMAEAGPNYQEVVKRAKEALKRIGKESRINLRRVKGYGVKID